MLLNCTIITIHHAEQALIFAKKVSPSDNYAAPVVLYFIRKELAPRLVPGSPIAMPALVMYKECRAAHKIRETKLKREKRKMDMKRLKEPNRYRCANPDCGILADSGTMFKQCRYLSWLSNDILTPQQAMESATRTRSLGTAAKSVSARIGRTTRRSASLACRAPS